MRLTYRDLQVAIRALGISGRTPLVAHASLSALGWVEGGAGTVVDVLRLHFECLMMPAFTYKPMLIPEAGPARNGMVYGSGRDRNRMAEFFHPGMPVDPLIGAIPEALRTHPASTRSTHPLLSFVGIGAAGYLERQTLRDPFGPLAALAESGGWVLLWGVGHTANTSLHLAEQQAGRPAFVRWALTPSGVRRCGAFPGCSLGFEPLAADLDPITRRVRLGEGWLLGLPLAAMIETAASKMRQKPAGFLCGRLACSRCQDVRRWALGVSAAQPAAA